MSLLPCLLTGLVPSINIRQLHVCVCGYSNYSDSTLLLEDTAYSGAHATAQHTGLQIKTMRQALFRGLF